MTGDSTSAEADHAHHVGVVRGLFTSAIGAVRTRLDLAAVEAEIFLLRTLRILLWVVAAGACALLALVFAVVTVIAALWDTHRMAGLLGGTALFVVLAGTFGYVAWHGLRRRRPILEGTLAQLETDQHRASGSP